MDYDAEQGWAELAELLSARHRPMPTLATRWVHEPGWSWRITMPDYDLWLVLAGRGTGRINGVAVSFEANSLMMFRPGDVAEFGHDPDDPLTVISCHYTFVDPATSEPSDLPEEWLPGRHVRLSRSSRLSDLLHRIMRLRRDPHPLRQLESASVLLSALIEVYLQEAQALGRLVPQIDPRLQEVLDFIAAEPSGRPTLAEAAAVAGLSPVYLSRLFSAQLGTTFRRQLLHVRLERGYQLLAESPMSVAEVARALGYDNVFLFSRQFSHWFGQPPSSVKGQGGGNSPPM